MRFLFGTLTFLFLPLSNLVFAKVPTSSFKNDSIEEVLAIYPERTVTSLLQSPDLVLPPQQTFIPFGGFSHSQIDLPEDSFPLCGPSLQTNTLSCFIFSKSYHSSIKNYPLPGTLSTTPVFFNGSWLFGTNKGFLLKVKANPENRNLPQLNHESIAFWGAFSRRLMATFRPKSLYLDSSTEQQTVTQGGETNHWPSGISWVFPSSSEFVGEPVIQNDLVYVLSSSGYLQALDWQSGKLIWAVRLVPDSDLHLQSKSLLVTSSEIIVGTSLGIVIVLDPKSGAILWNWEVQPASAIGKEGTALPAVEDRFPAIVAKPLLVGDRLVVSNAESTTVGLSLENRKAVWIYPLGSEIQPRFDKGNVILGGSNGSVVSLNFETGSLNWSTSISPSIGLAGLSILPSGEILAATKQGQVFLLNSNDGKIIASRSSIGKVVGDFSSWKGIPETCLSFSYAGFRCFQVMRHSDLQETSGFAK